MPLNSLKYSLKNQFTSIANSGVRASFDKLREIVSDAFDNASSSKNGEIDGAGMFGDKTPIFQFPLNAVADPTNPNGNHGHFILFYINKQIPAKYSFSEEGNPAGTDGNKSIIDYANQIKIPQFIRELDPNAENYVNRTNVEGHANMLNVDLNNYNLDIQNANILKINTPGYDSVIANMELKGEIGSNRKQEAMVRVERKETKRLETAIALYMPPTVNVSYGASYVDSEIGMVSKAAIDGYNEFMAKGKVSAAADAAFKSLGEDGKSAGVLKILSALGLQGARDAVGMATGQIIADRMELAFRGLPKRGFQYTFKMMPRNQDEAEEIRKIVFAFKSNMLPEIKEGTGGRGMVVPNTFDIRYMYMNRDNDFLHKISTCVLESMNITYGGDRYRTFPDAGDGTPPVETTMTLNFKELELITRERVYAGY